MKDVILYVLVRSILLALIIALFQGDINKEQVSCLSACLPPYNPSHVDSLNMP